MVAVYGNSLSHDFVTDWDDQLYVTGNSTVWGFSWEHLQQAFTNFYVGNYAPLQMVSYMLDYSLWGLKPGGFIAGNLFFHFLNGLLYYLLVWKLTARRWWTFAATFIFLIHPVQVESAVWISQRKNVLAMFFFLLALLLYIGYRERSRLNSAMWYAGSVAAFLCALLTKAVVVILPLILLVYDISFHRREERGRWLLNKTPYFLVAGITGLIALQSQRPEIGGGLRLEYHGGSPLATFFTMQPVMVRYMGMLAWPAHLSAFYDPHVKTGVDNTVILACLLLLILIVGAFYLYQHYLRLFFWSALFAIGLLPVIQIVPLVTLMNDRYLYFPMLGAAALVTGAAAEWVAQLSSSPRKIVILIFSILLICLPILSFNRAKVWQNSFTLWTDAYEKNPRNGLICLGLGTTYLRVGNLERARHLFEQAYELGMRHQTLLLNLGMVNVSLGDLAWANPYILELVSQYPNYVRGWMLLGEYRKKSGDPTGAEAAYQRAVQLQRDATP
jgi:protein O-mannosyl-transferase